MYCGACGDYIPSGLGITQCPKCGLPLDQSERLKAEKAARELADEKKRQLEITKSKRVYNYFEAIYFSFFCKDFYLNVIRKWRGIGFAYAVFVIGLGLIPFSLGLYRTLKIQVQKEALPVIDTLPVMTWSEGNLSINKPSPYTVRDVQNKNILLIADTAGNYTDLTAIPAYLLLTQNQMAFREDARGNVRVVRFAPINLVLTPEMVRYGVLEFTHWAPYLMFPIFWFIYALGFLALAFLYALGGKIAAFFMKCRLNFPALMRLAVIALTPMIILDSLVSFWYPLSGLWDSVTYTLPVIYVALALFFYRRAEKQAAAL